MTEVRHLPGGQEQSSSIAKGQKHYEHLRNRTWPNPLYERRPKRKNTIWYSHRNFQQLNTTLTAVTIAVKHQQTNEAPLANAFVITVYNPTTFAGRAVKPGRKECAMGTITLLKKAIANAERSIEAFQGDTNPLTKEMLIQAQARREAFQATLEALRGDAMMLRTFS
jgi:hypothetical protein